MADGVATFYYTILGLFWAFVVASVVATVARRHHPFLRERDMLFTWLSIAMACEHFTAILVPIADTDVSCEWSYWSTSMFVPFWAFPYICRCFVLWYRYRTNEWKLHSFAANEPRFHALFERRWLNSLWFKFVATYCVSFALFFINVITFLVHDKGIVNHKALSKCLGDYGPIVISVQGAVAFIFVMTVVVLLWNINDAYLLKAEMRFTGFLGGISLVVWAGLYFNDDTSLFESGDMILIMIFLFILGSVWMPVVMSMRSNYRYLGARGSFSTTDSDGVFPDSPRLSAESEQADGLAKRTGVDYPLDAKFLQWALQHDVLAAGFEQFAIRSFCVENYLFYKQARRYRLSKEVVDIDAEARRIFRQFIADDAPSQVNLVYKTMQDIRAVMEKKSIDRGLFAGAEREIFSLMYSDTFEIWKCSSQFKETMAKANYPTKAELIANDKAKNGEEASSPNGKGKENENGKELLLARADRETDDDDEKGEAIELGVV